MNRYTQWALTVLFLTVISPSASADLEAQRKAIEQAHETTEAVRSHFKKNLQKAFKEKGAVGALGECKIQAPQMGVQTGTWEVGRTSHKLRNPLNQPRAWLKPLLEEYQKTPVSQHPKQRLVVLGPQHYGYVEPIYVEAVCLNCHGAQISSEVQKELKGLYPQDQATGFKLGDFRGLIWLESRSP